MISEVQLPDYYKLLGVQPGATQREIDQAYQKLISKFDSSEGKSASVDQPTLKEQIEVAQEAYDTLFTVLTTLCRTAAPLLPLVTEEVFEPLPDFDPAPPRETDEEVFTVTA